MGKRGRKARLKRRLMRRGQRLLLAASRRLRELAVLAESLSDKVDLLAIALAGSDDTPPPARTAAAEEPAEPRGGWN